MKLSSDNYKILELFQQQNRLSVSFVLDKTGMTKKQLYYSIGKINDYLSIYGISEISINKDQILVPNEVRNMEPAFLNEKQIYYFEAKERLLAIELFILYRDNNVSLKDFIYLFEISKNTALNDVKRLNEQIQNDALEITYTRKDGYYIQGNEFIIRNHINHCLEQLNSTNNGISFLKTVFAFSEKRIEDNRSILSEIENALDIHFVESKIKYLPYLIEIIIRRVSMGKHLDEGELFFNELHDTREFETVSRIIEKHYGLNETECSYLTLLILSVSLAKFKLVDSDYVRQLSDAIEILINNFEKNACILFSEREKLKNNILQHMISAYYRMKYNLTLSSELSETIRANSDNEEFRNAYRILEMSIEPLENLIEASIPEIEMDFLVLQFIGWMRRQNVEVKTKERAIVVCLNGVTISTLMFVSLKEIFPEFVFTDVVSLREFEHIDPSEYDLVFSTIPLKTEKKVIVVENIIDLKYRTLLRERVFAELYDVSYSATDLGIVYHTIDSVLNKSEAERLKLEIARALDSKRNDVHSEYDSPSLADLIGKERIRIINSVNDYKEAILLSGKPLLEKGIIEQRYIDRIISNYDFDYPNILFGSEIAIPHASVEDGANRLAMSLLKINQGVDFASDRRVHIVVMLSPCDRKTHLKALLQLADLAFNDEELEGLVEAKNKDEIISIINKYK